MAVTGITPVSPYDLPDIPPSRSPGPGDAGDRPTGLPPQTVSGFGPAAEVSISPQARATQDAAAAETARPVAGASEASGADPATVGEETSDRPAASSDGGNPLSSEAELTREEQQKVAELQRREAEVRAHEQAHKAAGGPHTGGISYQYTTGPDNKRYVSGGEVSVDLSPVSGNPQATVQKMQTVKRAALAPANPSAADRAVYAQASRTEQKAQAEVRAENAETMRQVMDRPETDTPTSAAATIGTDSAPSPLGPTSTDGSPSGPSAPSEPIGASSPEPAAPMSRFQIAPHNRS